MLGKRIVMKKRFEGNVGVLHPTSKLLGIFLISVMTACLVACGGGSNSSAIPAGNTPPPLVLSTFQPAANVIGQVDFSARTSNQGGVVGANTLSFPSGAPAEGSLYVADFNNHRILGFNNISTVNNASANFVLGQNDFTSNAAGLSGNQFFSPGSVVAANGKLFVRDGYRRILIWNTLPISNVSADLVVGAGGLTNQGFGPASATTIVRPVGMTVADGRLIVADQDANRVMIWNNIPAVVHQAAADVVIGQSNFTDDASGTAAVKLQGPSDVWSDGNRVVVADTGNNRVLIWNSLPTTSGTAADVVIGQPDFISNAAGNGALGLNQPRGVYSNGQQLFVADSANNRVLVYNALPTTNQASPDVVLGQSTFSNVTANDDDQDGIADSTPSARTLSNPSGIISIGKQLFVVGGVNSRVLIYQGQ